MGEYLKLSVEEIGNGFILTINDEVPHHYRWGEVEDMWIKIRLATDTRKPPCDPTKTGTP